MPLLPPTAPVPLNALDLLVVHAMRRLGDLPMSVHVNFHGRIDLSQLQHAVDRLALRWPLITARLVRSPCPAWVPTGAQRVPIGQQTLASDSEADLLRAVQQLATHRFDVENEDPLRVIVLHRPGGDDVLTIQGSHILMDVHGAGGLLQQLLDPTRIPPDSDSVAGPTDVVASILAKTSFRDRMRALRRFGWLSARMQPVTLPVPEMEPAMRRDDRVTLRWIDETSAACLRERLERIGPFANPTLAILASGCRTLSRYIRGPLGPRSTYVMWLPYNLRRGPQKRLLFQNLFTRFMLVARPGELGDRDALLSLFASQVRAQLADNTTVELLVLAKILAQLSRWIPWARGRLRPPPTSVHGASVPEFFETGRAALGASLDYGWFSVPLITAAVSLVLIQRGGRLLAVFRHLPGILTDEQASQFFDQWLDDLLRP